MDAYSTALTLLSRRELSTRQLRERLARRKFPPPEIDAAIARLTGDGTLDDRRAAIGAARLEASIRRRGRRRVLQHIQQLGISGEIARAAVDEVFRDLDEAAILDQAIGRRLRGADPKSLDAARLARIARGLIGQGFAPGQVHGRLRQLSKKGALESDE
jgi:regulatory protein